MILSICRESSFGMSAVTLVIVVVVSLSNRPQNIELHQLLERDRRVEVLAREPQRLVQSLEDHLHPERQLLVVFGTRVLARDVGQPRHAVQLSKVLGEWLLVGERDLVAVGEPGQDRLVSRLARRSGLRLLALRALLLLHAPAGEHVVQLLVIDLPVSAPLPRRALADSGALDRGKLRLE